MNLKAPSKRSLKVAQDSIPMLSNKKTTREHDGEVIRKRIVCTYYMKVEGEGYQV